MNVKGVLVEGTDGELYLVGIGRRSAGAQTERPTIWRVFGAEFQSLEESRTASSTIRERLNLDVALRPGFTHDEHVKWAAIEGVNRFLSKFFAHARW